MKESCAQVGALDEIRRQQRLLYCHAYQSYLWNKVVSRRIRTYGIKVLAGDLVNEKKGDMVEKNGEKRSKEEYIEHIEDPDSRNMLVKPGDVTWKVVGYDDATEDLLVSDKESMEKTKGVSEKIDSGKF